MKHTQGQWEVINPPQTNAIFISSPMYGAICQIPADSKHVEEHQANAKLIAAAPELLEALKMAIVGLKGARQEIETLSEQLDPALLAAQPFDAMDSQILNAQAAINKATL